MNPEMQDIGVKVRAWRQKKGLTQEELAEKTNVHYSYIEEIESGKKSLTIEIFGRIIRALGISLDEFFGIFSSGRPNENFAIGCYNIVSRQTPEQQKASFEFLQSVRQNRI